MRTFDGANGIIHIWSLNAKDPCPLRSTTYKKQTFSISTYLPHRAGLPKAIPSIVKTCSPVCMTETCVNTILDFGLSS